MKLLARLAVLPILFYQRYISPFTPPSCRFAPSCSQYAKEALLAHGILRGGWLAVYRISRCHPCARGGWDPVPEPRDREPEGPQHDAPPRAGRGADEPH